MSVFVFLLLCILPVNAEEAFVTHKSSPVITQQNEQTVQVVTSCDGEKKISEREKRIWADEMNRMINYGHKVFHDPTLGTNGFSCNMCHPDTSNTHPETYPKFQTQTKKVNLLSDMINWCITNQLQGSKLSDDDPKMSALKAYTISARAGETLQPGKY